MRFDRFKHDTTPEIQGPVKLKLAQTISYFFPPVRPRNNSPRTKIIRCYGGVHGTCFRRRGEGEGRARLRKRRVRGAAGERWETMEGEGEDVTQAVLGLSARWIWHLEEQRPLTLSCGRGAACVACLVHTHSPRVSAKTYTRQDPRITATRSPVRAGRSDTPARRRMHT